MMASGEFAVLVCYWYGDHRDLHVLTHSFPTRRSSDLRAFEIGVGGLDDGVRMAIAVAHQKRGSFLPAVCVVEGEFRRPRSYVKVGAHGGSFQLASIHSFPPPPLLRCIMIGGVTGGPHCPSGAHLTK